MAFIDSSAIRPKFTSDLVAAYKGSLPASTFLQNKFKRVTKETDYLEINVQRFAAGVAKDVVRGSDGNRNQFATMVQKVEQPPFFYEYLDVMQLEGYNRAFGSMTISESAYRDFREVVDFNVKQVVNKIDRAYEIQAASVLLTGIVNTTSNGNTNFNRRGASITPYSGAIDWSNPDINPKKLMEAMCIYVTTIGQASGNVIDFIMGNDVYTAFVNNPIIQNESQKLWSVLTELEKPNMRGDGGVFHGQTSAGAFKCNIWTYPVQYNADITQPTVFSYYIPGNALIALPQNPYFVHGFAMVPRLPDYMGMSESGLIGAIGGEEGSGKGQYFVSEFVDMKRTAWYLAIKSAGLTWPIAVDQMATAFPLPGV